MRVCGRYFSRSLVERIREAVRAEPSLSRIGLSRKVCEWGGWRAANGRLQEMSCRKALNKLERAGVLDLPGPVGTYAFLRRATKRVDPEVPQVCCSLAELGEVSVSPVVSRYSKESRLWFALVRRYHYLKGRPLCGAQIRYLIKSPQGYLGALSFSSASWSLACRDKHIGWTEAARRAHLDRVVTNSRFLILPTVHVPNLASRVLSLALARLPQDWELRYKVRPVLVETFVDQAHTGTCYKAANFSCVGESAGRRDGKAKKVFLRPLSREWRETLRQEPGETPQPRPEVPRHWMEEEFGSLRVYDGRLKARLYTIAQDFYDTPQASIPEACGSKARTLAAYRFFQNSKVTMNVVLTPHREATIERIREHKVVLLPQDTTTLDYSTHPMTEGLGPTNNAHDRSLGLLLHDTLAFTEEGTPLGVVDAQCWARSREDRQKRLRRKELPIEQKESMKWLRSLHKAAEIQKLCPETMLVSIGDRESDIYDLFLEATRQPGPRLLVRAEKSRRRKVKEEDFLWDFMARQPLAGSLKVHVPRRGRVRARDIWLDIRFAEVTLKPPKGQTTPLTIWAVYAVEQGGKIQWMLLTTAPVANFEDARKRVEWYSGRWGIEVYHRTLKDGCRLKDRQLEVAARLQTCLGVDMVVAWRIYYMTMLGREKPDIPCTVLFKDVEWKALECFVHKTRVPPPEPPSISKAVFMIAGLGGHLGRKSDGFPGTKTVWRGLVKLYAAAEMYGILTHESYAHPMRAGP